jgi:subtilisin family serine protease
MSLRTALRSTLRSLPSRRLAPVTVAVVDSGVDATHPDLRGRVTEAYRVVTRAGSKPAVVRGARPRNADLFGHGTAVAGIIARIAPNARILDIRVLNDRNAGSGVALLAGFRHAVERGARVINMSLAAGAAFAPTLAAICDTAYRRNLLVVAARRNMPLVDEGFPAEIPTCIGVDIGRFRSPFHILFRENQRIEFAAHGEEVVVPAAGGGHTTMTGTSFATPAVSGLCALLVGAHPGLRPFDVKSILRAFAGPPPGTRGRKLR